MFGISSVVPLIHRLVAIMAARSEASRHRPDCIVRTLVKKDCRHPCLACGTTQIASSDTKSTELHSSLTKSTCKHKKGRKLGSRHKSTGAFSLYFQRTFKSNITTVRSLTMPFCSFWTIHNTSKSAEAPSKPVN
jgi:hypothetical protein